MKPHFSNRLRKASQLFIIEYLIVSLVFSPGLTAFAQESESLPPTIPEGTVTVPENAPQPISEIPTPEASVPVEPVITPELPAENPNTPIESIIPQAGDESIVESQEDALTTAPEENLLPSEGSKEPEKKKDPEEIIPPGEESMAMQGSGSATGGSDGSPNTIKQVLPDIDRSSGALVYSYPIKTPPGRNGIEPNLALAYNSLSHDGVSMFGYGWNINIPYIRRINKKGVDKLYTENYFESSLSGELVPVASSATAYIAKIDDGDFLKYDFSSTSTWTMTDKVGKIYTFGNASTTRQEDPGNPTRIFAWMLSEVRDLNGNYMTYEYTEADGQIYPDKIYYTEYGSSTAPFEVDFTRETVPKPIQKSDFGYAASSTYRIKEITTHFNDNWVRTYALGYATSTTGVRFLLDTITESGRSEASTTVTLPAVDFEYQSTTSTTFISETLGGNNIACPNIDTNQGVIITDANADGFSDFMNAYNGASSTYLHVGRYDGTSTWVASSTFAPPVEFVSSSTLQDLGVRLADINGDGRVDILKSLNGATSSVYFNTVSGWNLYTGSDWVIPTAFTDIYGGDIGTRIVDVNGDGLPDLIKTIANPGPTTYVWLNTGAGWTSDSGWYVPGLLQEGMVFGDFNNDGLMDLIQSDYQDSTHWYRGVYINDGKKSWTDNPNYNPGSLKMRNVGNDWGVREADVNGDGYSDLLQAMYSVGQAAYRNTGLDWASSSAWLPEWYFINSGDTGVRLADYDADGLVDALDCNTTGGGTDYFWRNPGKAPDLLMSIKIPFGGSTNITYQPTTQFKNGNTLLNPDLPFVVQAVSSISHGDGISPTSTEQFNYQGGRQYFVDPYDRKMAGFSKVTNTNNAGTVATTYFHQGDTSNSAAGEYNDNGSKIGKLYRTEVTDAATNVYSKLIKKWDSATSTQTPSSTFVSLLQTLAMTYDGDSDHRDVGESYSYSTSTGNLIQKKEWGEVTGSDDGSFSDTAGDLRTTDFTYASNTADYILALPATQTTTNASGTKVRETKYYYDGGSSGTVSIGNLTKEEHWATSSTYIDNEKAYNSYGLVTQTKDPRDKATTFTYDTWNLYPATTTNPLSQSTTYAYDYSSGQVSEQRDPNSLTFQSVFDGLDRLVEEKQPDANATSTLVTKSTLTYTDSYGASSVLRTNYLESGTSTVGYTYLDGFGRVIQTRTEAEASDTFAVVDTIYNNLERIEKESLPYFLTGSSRSTATSTSNLFVQYTYDPLLRVASTTTAVGSVSRMYDDWKVSIIDARNKTKYLYSNAFGNLIRVDELNSGATYTTTYDYDANNSLTKITDALSNLRNFTYNGLGQRLTAEDLHAPADVTFGTWSYTYDDAGNVIQTINPNNQTVNYTYDDLSRVLTEDYTGASSTEQTYVYDSCLLGVGKLCEASSTMQVTSQYQYSGLGTVARETKTVSSTTYQTDYTYDRQGNVITTTNPDSSVVTNIFNTAGQLETILTKEAGVSTTTLVSSIEYGPHGKPTITTAISGSGSAITTNTYDAANLYRLTRKITTVSTSTSAGPPELYTTSLYSDGNLLNYYRFEGNSNDSKGSNNGTDTSISYSSGSGKFGQGAGFGGSSKIVLSSLPVNAQNITMSVSFWVKTGSASRQRFMDLGVADNYINKDYFQPEIYSSSVVAGDFAGYSGVSSATSLTDNSWHHVVYTIDGGSTYKLYIDGVLKDTKSTSGLRITDEGALSKQIGRTYDNALGLNGTMDDLAFFSRELSVSEVSTLYGSTTQSVTVQDLAYTYDANGNITRIVDTSNTATAKTVDFAYDDLNRLSTASTTSAVAGSNYFATYAYTAIGNISSSSLSSTTTLSGPTELYTTSLYNDANLVNYYRFEGNSNDSKGSNNGSDTSISYSSGNGKFGQGAGFGGSSHIDLSSLPINSQNITMSVVFWAKTGTTSRQRFMDMGVSDGSIYKDYFQPEIYNSGTVSGDFSAYGGVSSATNVTDNTWHHFAYTIDSGSTYKLYIDGQLKDTKNTSSLRITDATALAKRIGRTQTDLIGVNGSMDDIAFFSKVLSGSEISLLYNGAPTAATSTLYTYGGGSYTNPHAVTTVGSSTYSYDTNGNLTSDSVWTHSWDHRNRLMQSTKTGATSTYQYDHGNMRVRLMTGTSTTVTATPTYSTEGGVAVKHLMVNGELIATIRGSGSSSVVYTVETDHLGSPEKTVSASGTIVELSDYYPYGSQRQNTGTLDDRKGYIGQDYDEGTALSQFGRRYYKGAIGRFISQDPMFWEMPLELLSDPQQNNAYAYARNNPLRYIDPLGLFNMATGQIEKGDTLGAITGQLNNAYGTNLNVNQVAGANGISNPNLIFAGGHIALPGANAQLNFNGSNLYVRDNTYNTTLPGMSWNAVSGNVQTGANRIPEGTWKVDPKNTQYWDKVPFLNQVGSADSPLINIATFGLKPKTGAWPGGTWAWGFERTEMSNVGTGQQNTGYFIHGGVTAGSAGCIDLTGQNGSFHSWLQSRGSAIDVVVKY